MTKDRTQRLISICFSYTVESRSRDNSIVHYRELLIDITYSRLLKRQFHFCMESVPSWIVGGATVLLSGKGLREGAIVSILATAIKK
jgi:hypothetical protein